MSRRLSFSSQTIAATEVVWGAVRVTPRAQVFAVRLPFGGCVWSRPKHVQVAAKSQVRRIGTRSSKGEQDVIDTVNASSMTARYRQPSQVRMYEMSASQIWLGALERNCRCTRSGTTGP